MRVVSVAIMFFLLFYFPFISRLYHSLDRARSLVVVEVVETLFSQGGTFSPKTGIQRGPASIKTSVTIKNLI